MILLVLMEVEACDKSIDAMMAVKSQLHCALT